MMTKQGGAKLVETMIKKYGSYEAYKQSMRERASKGGSVKGTEGGFAARISCSCSIIQGQHIKAQCSGFKGGTISKRRKKNVQK